MRGEDAFGSRRGHCREPGDVSHQAEMPSRQPATILHNYELELPTRRYRQP
jgi:hypothetical protein